MRRHHFITALGLLALLACSDQGTPVNNGKPTAPESPSPPDNGVNQSTVVQLTWSVPDGDGGDHFDVYLGTDEHPPLAKQGITVPRYQPPQLLFNTHYYWRVVNSGNGEVGGPLWQFTTGFAEPPEAPSQPNPPDNASVALDPVALKWLTASPDENVEYDLYFGTATDPPLVESALATDSVMVSVLAPHTYYWRVVARDEEGCTNSGPTWHFNATPVVGHMYNRAGTGGIGLGEPGQLPLDTELYWPQDIAFAPDGTLVVVDWQNHRVLGTDPSSGVFFVIAGPFNGMPGEPCSFYPALCDDIDAAGSSLNHPTSVTFAADGRLVLSAWHNSCVFLIDIPGGVMSRIAGTGKPCYNGDDRPAIGACVYLPAASVFDLQGRLCFTDQANMVIRRIDASGDIHTMAGTQPVFDGTRYVPQAGFAGDDGPATSAKFKFDGTTTCGKLCIDAAGNIYVADTLNHAVRVIDTAGMIHRFAGLRPASPGFSGDGGLATSAQLKEPRDVACDANGNVFICDTGNHCIRMVTPGGIISTVAGIPGVPGNAMDDGKLATQSGLKLPYGIDIDPDGNLWIADTENSRIRIVYR